MLPAEASRAYNVAVPARMILWHSAVVTKKSGQPAPRLERRILSWYARPLATRPPPQYATIVKLIIEITIIIILLIMEVVVVIIIIMIIIIIIISINIVIIIIITITIAIIKTIYIFMYKTINPLNGG